MSTAERTDPASVPKFELRHRLRLALEHGGMTVGRMARELGVSRNTVGSYLAGRTRPRRSDLVLWADLCKVPLPWLMTGEASSPDGPDGAEWDDVRGTTARYHRNATHRIAA